MRCKGFSYLAVRKSYMTTFWAILLAVVLAVLIVKLNAMAAGFRTQNVVSFYPTGEQTITYRSADMKGHASLTAE